MCEMLLIRSEEAEPFRLSWAMKFALAMEHWGIAGFGWGVAWWDEATARLGSYKAATALAADEQGRERLGAITTNLALFHLRRPSRLETISYADTQPFLSDTPPFAFAHNGAFGPESESIRLRLLHAGELHGSADSEVGFQLVRECLGEVGAREVLTRIHRTLGGEANLMLLTDSGLGFAYAGNRSNAIYSLQFQNVRVIATELHSPDDSLVRLIFDTARDVRSLPLGAAEAIG